jgi:hypothetical protein
LNDYHRGGGVRFCPPVVIKRIMTRAKMNTQKNECCSCGCGSPLLPQKHQINMDLLLFDPDICPRCRDIENVLNEAVSETEALFETSGVQVRIVVNKINIASKELAISHKFENPPTIRIDGQDIDLKIPENLCALCGNLCGKDIENGLWMYLEEEYSISTKAFIINSILSEAYGRTPLISKKEYIFPCNLEVFFRNKRSTEQYE